MYFWVDGIYFNIRVTGERPCFLVILGATADGKKELVAIQAGCRESEESWLEALLDLKARGLRAGPRLAIGDGSLGFWKALRKAYPGTKQQRCWVHKTRNVLDKLPKSVQEAAKKHLQEIYLAPTREEAEKGFELFRGGLLGQAPEGGGVSGEGSRGAPGLLRLPCAALAAPQDDESDRVDVRNAAPPDVQDARERFPGRVPGDGVQARAGRRA